MADGWLARHAGKPLYCVAWRRVRCHHNICCRLEPPPAPVMHPVRAADLLPQATATAAAPAATVGAAAPEVSAEGNNEDYLRTDDRKDNNSISQRDNVTAVLQLPDASETPDICSASDLRCSFHVFFIYLLLVRLTCSPGQRISLVEAAALLCLL